MLDYQLLNWDFYLAIYSECSRTFGFGSKLAHRIFYRGEFDEVYCMGGEL